MKKRLKYSEMNNKTNFNKMKKLLQTYNFN